MRSRRINNFFWDKATGFLCYSTTKEDIKRANEIYAVKFSETDCLNSKTVYARPSSRMAGIIGEIAFRRWLDRKGYQYEYVGDDDRSCDFIVVKPSGTIQRIDVKCKCRNVEPQKRFEASFFEYQASFKNVTGYAFLSTMVGYEYVWFCGHSSKSKWLNHAYGKLWEAGDVDLSNGKVFHKNTWSVFYENLPQFDVSEYVYEEEGVN